MISRDFVQCVVQQRFSGRTTCITCLIFAEADANNVNVLAKRIETVLDLLAVLHGKPFLFVRRISDIDSYLISFEFI